MFVEKPGAEMFVEKQAGAEMFVEKQTGSEMFVEKQTGWDWNNKQISYYPFPYR